MKMSRSRLAPVCATALISLAAGVFTVRAHDNHVTSKSPSQAQVDEHWKLDFGFPGFEELNKKLQRDFDTFKERTTAEMFTAMAPAAAPNAHLVGSWSPVYEAPIVPIHTTVLVDGRVLFWDSVADTPAENNDDHSFTRAAILDPVTNALVRVDNTTTGYNLFCAGFAHLPDGRPLLAGGNLNSSLDGTRTIHFFDHLTDQWSLSPLVMAGGRWYPSVTPLASGEMLITSGRLNTHEVFTTAETLRVLSSATLSMPLYPWLHAATNGDALYFGPDNRMNYLNTAGTGSWRTLGARDGVNRDYGSFAMFDAGKVLAAGGASSVRSAVVIDFMNPNLNPAVLSTASMAFGRRQHNLTVLPDGGVLATGGNYNGAGLIDRNAGVYAAEMWKPSTGQWTTLASAVKTRQYHSTAILLPDGRVFTGGGGICGTCYQVGYLEKNYEIFSPPYLFKKDGSGELAPRPEITQAPTQVVYNQTFDVSTPAPAEIRQVVMMRVPSVTHSVNFEQRRLPLSYKVEGGVLRTVAPPNSNVAPPGYYMLFLVDEEGVPSVSKMVRVSYGGLGAPVVVAATAGTGSATLSWIPVYGATGYTVSRGPAPGQYDSSQNIGNVTTHTVSGLTAGATYYFTVAARDGAGTGGRSNEVSATIPNQPIPPGTGTGLTGRYHNGTSFNTLVTTRLDPVINFAWGSGSPASGVGADNFSVRWTGSVQASVGGAHTFYTTSDDGVRLWINSVPIVNNWTDHSPTVNSGSIDLQAGTKYPVIMEFYERGGGATAKLEWSANGLSRQIVPTLRLYPDVGNLARGKPAVQKSTHGGPAARAVDGNTNGNYSAGSVTRTQYTSTPWWHVDLGAVSPIGQIKLWNRTDCCSERLSNFRVFVSDVPFTSSNLNTTINQPGVSNWRFAGSFTGSTTFTINRTGRYVRIQLEGTNYLSLAEVEVFGAP